MPGDWAIHRGGTVHVRHASGIVFARGNWTRSGGNALLFSHGAKDCAVTDSEFFSLGDSGKTHDDAGIWVTFFHDCQI